MKKAGNWVSKTIWFILYPFIVPVRYGALKIMKKMRSADDKHPMMAVSDHLLNEIVLPSVFGIFREGKFREMAYFKKLPTSEHDRIFNEMEVAGICLAIFYLRTSKLLTKPEDYHFWQGVEEYLPRQLQETLVGYGVDGANVKLLKQLVNMRHEEYENLMKKIWDVNDEEKIEFRNLPSGMKRIAAAVQAIAIGTTDHIRRGKIKEKDPLTQYLISWLLLLQKKIGKFVRNL